jgi:hypothetical protein
VDDLPLRWSTGKERDLEAGLKSRRAIAANHQLVFYLLLDTVQDQRLYTFCSLALGANVTKNSLSDNSGRYTILSKNRAKISIKSSWHYTLNTILILNSYENFAFSRKTDTHTWSN